MRSEKQKAKRPPGGDVGLGTGGETTGEGAGFGAVTGEGTGFGTATGEGTGIGAAAGEGAGFEEQDLPHAVA